MGSDSTSSFSCAVDGTADMELPVQPQISSARRFVLLLIFCLAQFLDAFSGLALFSAIPTISADLGLSENEAVWLISAFGLTFASFLLLSGKISDVYNPSKFSHLL
jgi:predicted MFS family arabinose efflux permease